jgi:hypothetical protein
MNLQGAGFGKQFPQRSGMSFFQVGDVLAYGDSRWSFAPGRVYGHVFFLGWEKRLFVGGGFGMVSPSADMLRCCIRCCFGCLGRTG